MPALEGARAVVTGGASGIGREICLALGEAGASVLVADPRREPKGEAPSVFEAFDGFEGEAHHAETDVTDPDSVAATFDAAASDLGGVDVLVNNAGVGHFESVRDADVASLQAELAVSVTGTFLCCKHGLPLLTDNEASAVVNLSSIYGLGGGVGNFGYAAAKGAVATATKQLAVEFGPEGVRTNAVAPGFIDSRMLHEDTPAGTADWAEANTPQRRLGRTDEIASVVRFLASADASFVNGEVVAIDGGFTAKA